MFKRPIIAIALSLAVFFTSTASYTTRICLNTGSYIFTKKGKDIYRMQMDGNVVTKIDKIRIVLIGKSPNERIAVNSCNVFFSWEAPGKLSEIYKINPANGWALKAITHTKGIAELDPAVDDSVPYLAFTQDSDKANVAVSYLDGSMLRTAAENASAPAWHRFDLSYTDLATGTIHPWNAPGFRHLWLPDGTGFLVQNGLEYYIWPVVGTPRHFATGVRSVAFMPYDPNGTNYAAVVNIQGNLEIWTLDDLWMPTGTSVAGPNIPDLQYVTWINVRQNP